jgi:hypothetical protein
MGSLIVRRGPASTSVAADPLATSFTPAERSARASNSLLDTDRPLCRRHGRQVERQERALRPVRRQRLAALAYAHYARIARQGGARERRLERRQELLRRDHSLCLSPDRRVALDLRSECRDGSLSECVRRSGADVPESSIFQGARTRSPNHHSRSLSSWCWHYSSCSASWR